MTEPVMLPPGCLLRPARASDQWAISKLTHALQRSASLATTTSRWHKVGIWLGLGLVGAIVLTASPELVRSLMALAVRVAIVLLLSAAIVGLAGVTNTTQSWSRYWVVEYDGQVIACAKLYRYDSHSELYDVFVVPAWRQRGIGSCLVRYLIKQSSLPLYLASLPKAMAFYQRLGFVPIAPRDLLPLVQVRLSLNNPRFQLTALVLQPPAERQS